MVVIPVVIVTAVEPTQEDATGTTTTTTIVAADILLGTGIETGTGKGTETIIGIETIIAGIESVTTMSVVVALVVVRRGTWTAITTTIVTENQPHRTAPGTPVEIGSGSGSGSGNHRGNHHREGKRPPRLSANSTPSSHRNRVLLVVVVSMLLLWTRKLLPPLRR